MRIINESQTEYRQRIGSFLQQCAPDQHGMNIPEVMKLQPFSIRDLAWMIAILEKPYPYVAIPWEEQSLKDRVEVLHNCFLSKIERDTEEHGNKDEFKSLPHDVKTTAIQQFMGVTWDITHDYNGKGIPTYWMNFDTEQDKYNTTLIGVISSASYKSSNTQGDYIPIGLPVTISSINEEQRKIWAEMKLPMMPWNIKHNKVSRTNQIMRLLREICIEDPLRIELHNITKPINSYNLAFIISICLKGYDKRIKVDFSDLTLSAEVANIHYEMWDLLKEQVQDPQNKFKYTDEVDMRSEETFEQLSVDLLPHYAQFWIENKFIDITTNKDIKEALIPHHFIPKKYTDTAINVAVVQNILPNLLPDKKSNLTSKQKTELSWNCFQNLANALEANGAKIREHLIAVRRRTAAVIKGTDEYLEEINTNYDSFRHTFDILLAAYCYDLPLDKKRF